MAEHIKSIKTSGIRQVDKDQFYKELIWGDLIFCEGDYTISKEIEGVTSSPFSHVLMAWLPAESDIWLTLESTKGKGVHVGKLSDYIDRYNGDIVIGRRSLTDDQKHAILNTGFAVLEDSYDWQQEASIVAHKLVKAIPVVKPKAEYYCSGLQYLMSLAAPPALKMPGPNLPTPEDNWTDPSVTAICCLIK